MRTINTVTRYWLTLRSGADDAARSSTLARKAAQLAGSAPVIVHDLGSGTGAMMNWLSPQLPAPQKWVLHDADPRILEAGARDRASALPDRPTIVSTVVEELSELPLDAFASASLVTASALLDVITPSDALRIVAALVESRTPAFFSLTVTGSVRLTPSDPADADFEAAFNEHQRRERDGQTLLGPRATLSMRELFDAAGWVVKEQATPWLLGPDDRDLIVEWLEGWLEAAVEQRPELSEDAARYRDLRLSQLERGVLRVSVQHRDLLAWPR